MDQAETDRDGFKIAPIGAGPYKATYNVADGAETFAATANWWGPTPYIKKIYMTLIPDRQVSLIRYENNETDFLFADAGNIPAIWDPSHPRHGDLHDMGGFGLWWYSFVQDHEPFDDIDVRKAVAHGLDISSVMTAVMGPLTVYPAGITLPGEACYQPGTEYAYDVELARQHLAASRYGSGENVPPITVAVPTGYATYVRMWEFLQEQMKDNLGITLNIIRLEPGQDPPETVELQLGALGKRIPDPSTMLSDFGSQMYRAANGNEHLPWNDPTLAGQLVKAQTTALDDPDYCANWQAVERTLVDALRLSAMGNRGSQGVVHAAVDTGTRRLLGVHMASPSLLAGRREGPVALRIALSSQGGCIGIPNPRTAHSWGSRVLYLGAPRCPAEAQLLDPGDTKERMPGLHMR